MLHKINYFLKWLRKLYIVVDRKYTWWIKEMDKIQKINGGTLDVDEIGLLFWKLESIEDFFPCYKNLIKNEK